ncbi:MAG: hypothetical protein AAF556_06420 [Pseudomonadota bacterium]
MTALSVIVDSVELSAQPFHYGVEVDVDSFSPPADLKHISLLFKGEGGDIDETLMDVIISYGLAGVEVVLEIPAEQADIDAKYMVSVAANAGFSLSLLPPAERSDEADLAYFERLKVFAEVYFTQTNFGQFLAPVTNFIEYLFVETLLGDDHEFEVSDPYILQRLSALSDTDFTIAFKDRLRADIYGIFDGEDKFKSFARRMTAQIHEFSRVCAKDIVDQYAGAGNSGGELGGEQGGSGAAEDTEADQQPA